MNEVFRKISRFVSNVVGSPWSFVGALLIIIVWFITGPLFGFSDTWQLVINTGTTIVTFLIVFLIQNTQNRDSRAIHLKLDELIESIQTAKNEFVDIEDVSDLELDKLHKHFQNLHKKYQVEVERRKSDKPHLRKKVTEL